MATQLPSNAGASNTLFNHSRPNEPKSSRFDLSRFTNFTADAGMIIPFDWFVTLPGDRGSINFRMMLDTLPLVVAPMTGYKVTTHWYKCRMSDLWRGWNTFITKGRTGNISKKVPLIDLELPLSSEDYYYAYYTDPVEGDNEVLVSDVPVSSHSLSAFLGVPPYVSGNISAINGDGDSPLIDENFKPFTRKIIGNSNATPSNFDLMKSLQKTNFNSYRYVNALPFMMYQSIVKNNYVNQNLLEKNTALFPEEGDDHWMLPYNADVVNYVGFEKNSDVPSDRKFYIDGVFSSDDTVVRLDQLRYAQFDDDYFTTSLKWLQRGDAPSMDFDLTGFNLDDITGVLDDTTVRGNVEYSGWGDHETVYQFSDGSIGKYDGTYPTDRARTVLGVRASLASDLLRISGSASGRATSNITANKLRELLALSVWQERNARVNGSYNAMIYQHWQVNPNVNEHKPIYIGGTVDYINFANVLQNSESGSTPLGTAAGRGSTSGSSFVGNFTSDNDYGLVMGIMIIKPDTSYMQGVEHFLSCENVFEDYIQPEFESLSPQPILNKEIYVSGDPAKDNDLFGYQERGVYLKVRQNVNRGLFQCDPRKDSLFAAYTQSRFFISLPKLSYQFLCMSPNNMRRDWLAYPSMPAFKVQTASEVFVTRRLSYTSEPNTFGF